MIADVLLKVQQNVQEILFSACSSSLKHSPSNDHDAHLIHIQPLTHLRYGRQSVYRCDQPTNVMPNGHSQGMLST